MSIGKRIFEQRTAHNLSQEELAERLAVSRQSVSKWETDAAVPDLDKLIKLCDIFDVTLDELSGRANYKESPVLSTAIPTENKQPTMHQKTIGYILLAVSLIAGILVLLLAEADDGGILSGLIAATVFCCSLVCLIAKKHAGYWCAWIAFAPIVMLTPFVVGLAVYRWRILLQIGWYCLMGLAARKYFAGTTITANRKRTTILILGWVAVVVVSILNCFTVNALLTHMTLTVLVYSGVAWLLTQTIAYMTRKQP